VEASIVTMNYKSIVFREFTQESLQRIKHYRQERSERDNDEHLCLKKPSKDEPIALQRVPDKQLAVGQTLPRMLQHKFPNELIGKPIEEIDDYYRTENVCNIF
jgi:hypothetical protein